MTTRKGGTGPLERECLLLPVSYRVFMCLRRCVAAGETLESSHGLICSPQLAAPSGSRDAASHLPVLSSLHPPVTPSADPSNWDCSLCCRYHSIFLFNLSSLGTRSAHLVCDHLLQIDPQPACHITTVIMALNPVICHAMVHSARAPYTC